MWIEHIVLAIQKVCKEGKPISIIIKFACYDVRSTDSVQKKKKLKGKSFLITESLAATRVGFLERGAS